MSHVLFDNLPSKKMSVDTSEIRGCAFIRTCALKRTNTVPLEKMFTVDFAVVDAIAVIQLCGLLLNLCISLAGPLEVAAALSR